MFAQILKHVCKVNANQFQITEVINSVNQYKLCVHVAFLYGNTTISLIISLYMSLKNK